MNDDQPMTTTASTSNAAPIAVQVRGIVRGREVDAAGRVTLDADALLVEWPEAAAWRLAFDGLEGMATQPRTLTLYLRDHDVLELTGDDALRPFALALRDRACRMPELTRGLRVFGLTRGAMSGSADAPSVGAVAGTAATQAATLATAHDAWFAPLLNARRAVQGVSDPLRQVALMCGATLSTQMLKVLADLSVQLAPDNAAEQRALEAVMEDESAPLFDALARMAMAGDALQGGAADTQLADWRRWVDEARRAFAAADDAWGAIAAVLRAG